MKWNSLRTRLMGWNMLILSLALAIAATAMFFALRTTMHVLVDRELQARAGRFTTSFAAGHYGMGQGMGRGGGMGFGRGRGWRQWSNEMDKASPSIPATPPDDTAEVERLLLLHRPRYLDREGQGIGPSTRQSAWDAGAARQVVSGEAVFSTVVHEGAPVRVLTVPLVRDNRIMGTLQVAQEISEFDLIQARLLRLLPPLILAALLLAAAGSLFLTRQVLSPVRRITHAAARIEAQDLSRRLEVHGTDEIAELATTFNGMTARLERSFDALQRAYEQQRRFTADVSHELRTPLTRIKGITSLALASDASLPRYREALEVADAAADAMHQLVNDLLLLARSDSGQLQLQTHPLPIEDVLRDAVTALPHLGAPVTLDLPPALPLIQADQRHLERVFLNLMDNARRHTPADGSITVSAGALNEWLEVSISDTGEGIAPEHLPHLGERFYRVDRARARAEDNPGGTGLGLAISQGIVQAHGGQLTLDSTPGQGTTVTVRLPLPDNTNEPSLPLH